MLEINPWERRTVIVRTLRLEQFTGRVAVHVWSHNLNLSLLMTKGSFFSNHQTVSKDTYMKLNSRARK